MAFMRSLVVLIPVTAVHAAIGLLRLRFVGILACHRRMVVTCRHGQHGGGHRRRHYQHEPRQKNQSPKASVACDCMGKQRHGRELTRQIPKLQIRNRRWKGPCRSLLSALDFPTVGSLKMIAFLGKSISYVASQALVCRLVDWLRRWMR